MEVEWVDPLPLDVWNAMTDQQRQEHIDRRQEKQDRAADLITGRGIEIIFQSSGAFRDDWNYDDFNDNDAWLEAMNDVIFSLSYHDNPH